MATAADDDPFADPGSGRTFIMPTPGQRTAPGPLRRAADRPPAGASGPALEELIPGRGLNPLVAAAAPLLNSAVQMRASTVHTDPAALRETLARGIRAFETRATQDGVPPRQVLAARYVLCTFLDETAAATPWGGSGVWSRHSLLVMFHEEVQGGEKVFQLLAKLAEDPKANRDLLELIWIVLALGFEGRYGVLPGGRAQLDQLRERLLGMVQAQRGPVERELSPHWKGVRNVRPLRLRLPLWSLLAFAGAAAAALYLGLLFGLNRRSDPVAGSIRTLRVETPLAPQAAPVVPPAPVRPRLAQLLAPEIQSGRLAVSDLADRSIVTLRGDGLFESGGATVAPDVLPLFDRIGQALAALPGPVVVIGHTDNQPIRSARFPSNWHLSQERAASVQALLAARVPAARIKAEGRADSQPAATNATADGRARNRRVEITLYVAERAG